MKKQDLLKKISTAVFLLSANSLLIADENLVAERNNQPMMSNQDTRTESSTSPSSTPALGDKPFPYNNPNRFLFETSFIYWQADVDGLEFALNEQTTVEADRNTFFLALNGKIKERRLNFQWDPGFKVGMGVIFGERDEWDLFLNWTWLRSKATKSFNNNEDIVINVLDTSSEALPFVPPLDVSSFSNSLLPGPLKSGDADWKLQYNTIDLELGRNFFLGKNFTIRPIVGVRAAWLFQETHNNFVGVPLVIEEADEESSTEISLIGFPFPISVYLGGSGSGIGELTALTTENKFSGKNDFTAVGLRAGFDMRWNFLNHFCAYSTFSGSVLYGLFDIKEFFSEKVHVSVGGTRFMEGINFDFGTEFTDTYHATRTNLQVLLGLMWHTGFNNDKQHLSIGASYEVNEWFQQNELRKLVVNNAPPIPSGSSSSDVIPFTQTMALSDVNSRGNLGLHGVSLDIKFDF